MDKVPANLPDDISVVATVDGNNDGKVVVVFDDLPTRGLSPFEAGELAYALFDAATRAIALAHEAHANTEPEKPVYKKGDRVEVITPSGTHVFFDLDKYEEETDEWGVWFDYFGTVAHGHVAADAIFRVVE